MDNAIMNTAPEMMNDVDAALMNIYVFFREDSGERTSDLFISRLSTIFTSAAPLIGKYSGRISFITEAGISAIFPGGCEDALGCAVEICSVDSARSSGDVHSGLTVGIHYGSVTMGTIGSGEFSTFIAVSRDNRLARSLSETADSFAAKILISGTAASRIRNFSERYSARRLGLMHSRLHDREFEVYDVFDGDSAERKYTKRRSRMFFEKGVELFLGENWLQARSYFIELLKFDRSDRPAMEYIYKCDQFISNPGSDKDLKYLAAL